MYPFPATIDGKSVMVYDIHQTDTGAVCAIVHPNGLTGFAQWSRLIVTPTQPTIQRAEPVVDLAALCRILDASGPDDLIAAACDVKGRLDDADKARADLQAQLEDIEQSDRDLLDESIEVARALEIDTGGDYDLIARAREVMDELRDLRAKVRGRS